MKTRLMALRSVLLAILLYGLTLSECKGQRPDHLFSGIVVNEQGLAVSHAEISGTDDQVLGVTTDDGTFSFQEDSSKALPVRVRAIAYDTVTVTIIQGSAARIILQRQQQSVI